MMNDGLIVFNHDLEILSFNKKVMDVLGFNDLNDNSEQLLEVLNKSKEFQSYLQNLKEATVPPPPIILNLESPKGISISIRVKSSKSAEIANRKHYYVIITPYNEKNWEEIHLNRSLKFNSINKIAPSVAHEIRNPLSTLAIQRQILENSLQSLSIDPDNEQRIYKSLRILNTEVDRVSKLMEHFFRLVRTGSQEPTYEDINSILREIYELVKQYCYENAVEISLELERDVPFVYIKRDKFIQVLLNIIINSVESMSDKGILRILSHKEEEKSVIQIEDDGSGISDDQEDKIFSYYYSTKKDGGGVSLALSSEIIQEMQGRIFFKSNQGPGVTFTIELPKASKF